jgi:hypothetical protein
MQQRDGNNTALLIQYENENENYVYACKSVIEDPIQEP